MGRDKIVNSVSFNSFWIERLLPQTLRCIHMLKWIYTWDVLYPWVHRWAGECDRYPPLFPCQDIFLKSSNDKSQTTLHLGGQAQMKSHILVANAWGLENITSTETWWRDSCWKTMSWNNVYLKVAGEGSNFLTFITYWSACMHEGQLRRGGWEEWEELGLLQLWGHASVACAFTQCPLTSTGLNHSLIRMFLSLYIYTFYIYVICIGYINIKHDKYILKLFLL